MKQCRHKWKYMNVNNMFECIICGYYKDFTKDEIIEFEKEEEYNRILQNRLNKINKIKKRNYF